MVREHSARFSFLLTMFFLAASALAQPQYEVVDLTELYGDQFTPEDINNDGVIGANIGVLPQACVVEDGKLRLLPDYKGQRWHLRAIADNGDAIGGGGIFRGFFYHNGKVVDIGVSGEHGESSFDPARGLNDQGQVVGETGAHRPFLWQGGKVAFLDAPMNGGGAADINESSFVAGDVLDPTRFAARWTGGGYENINPPWSNDSYALGINEAGHIAGWAFRTTGGQRPVLWQGDKAIDLGDFGGGIGEARALNDLDQVVGNATNEQFIQTGFLWEKGNLYKLEDLIPGGSGFVNLEIPFSINNEGQVLCSGFTGNDNHWLLLNPVPEPSPILALMVGICAAISRRIVRRE